MDRDTAIELMTINTLPVQPWKVIDEKKDLDLAMWESEKTLYVNFKGSDSLKDWLFNFTFWSKKPPYKNMTPKFYLHSGFSDLYHVARDDIHRKFLESGVKKIVILGHSLGGALATICYADFIWHRENDEKYYNIEIEGFASGAPRVLHKKGEWTEFVRLTKGLTRLVWNGDLVTHVPFKLFGFTHVSKENVLYFGREIKFLFQPQCIYKHVRESYLARIKNYNHKDNPTNNRVFLGSIIAFGFIYAFIGLGLISLIIGLF